jgi:mannose-6-phosphate isomerase-like protein (cupin superfamily)
MELTSLIKTYNLEEIDKRLGDTYWSPIDVAYINDWVLRAAAAKGEYHWHSHNDDELFLVYKGAIVIDTEHGSISLKEGEGTVIPKGIQHKPRSESRSVILLLEPQRVKPTGD